MAKETTTKQVRICKPCMAGGKPAPLRATLELDIREANQLIGTQCAKEVSAEAEKPRPPAKKAETSGQDK